MPLLLWGVREKSITINSICINANHNKGFEKDNLIVIICIDPNLSETIYSITTQTSYLGKAII